MSTSRNEEQVSTNGVVSKNNEKKPAEPSLEVKPGGGMTVLDLASSSPPDEFHPGWRFYTSFTSLCIITLAVALDATTLSVALPVIGPPSFLFPQITSYEILIIRILSCTSKILTTGWCGGGRGREKGVQN